MKLLKTIGIIFLLNLLTLNLFGQCNVSVDSDKDGNEFITNAREKLYVNVDFENGILVAYAQLAALKPAENPNIIKYAIFVVVGNNGNKQTVVPRKMKIDFSDGTHLALDAESLQSPTELNGVYLRESTIKLTTDQFFKLKTTSIKRILIIDHRENRKIICSPYADLLKEQASCITKKV